MGDNEFRGLWSWELFCLGLLLLVLSIYGDLTSRGIALVLVAWGLFGMISAIVTEWWRSRNKERSDG